MAGGCPAAHPPGGGGAGARRLPARQRALGGFGLGGRCSRSVVSLALQVGVNYANDYSDGIRGTDADRVGPLRLAGSGAAPPRQVKAAAFAAFGVAGVRRPGARRVVAGTGG